MQHSRHTQSLAGMGYWALLFQAWEARSALRYEYTVNMQGFKAAQALFVRRNPRQRALFIIWHRIMPCIGLASLALFIRDVAFHHFSYPAWLGGLLAGLSYLGLFPFMYRPFSIRKLYRTMKNDRPDDHPLEVEVIGAELVSRIPGSSEGRFLRSAIRDYYEDAQSALLLISKRSFLLMPKRTLPEAAFAEVRAWMETSAIPENNAR